LIRWNADDKLVFLFQTDNPLFMLEEGYRNGICGTPWAGLLPGKKMLSSSLLYLYSDDVKGNTDYLLLVSSAILPELFNYFALY
jgi:hypothetical protein